MSEWRKRAEITGDVVFFRYATDATESAASEVYVWDLDKTYLDTAFETLRGLIKTVMEKAFQKRNVPGTATLVRALRNSWREQHEGRSDFPIYFITASPPQLESKIHQKLNLDGIYPFGIFCKDNLKNLHPSRLSRLKQQVGFKLQALLQLRLHLGPQVRQVLWGDDSEADAVIYSLYSDVCARRLSEADLRQVLRGLKVTGQQVETILRLQETIPTFDPVEKIYINLAVDTDAEYYLKFGRRVVPTYNTFQAALDLYQDGRLSVDQVLLVAVDMVRNYGFTSEELQASLDDMVRRPVLGLETVQNLLPRLQNENLIDRNYLPTLTPKMIRSKVGPRVLELEGNREPWVPEQIDYLHDYR
ncbi:MAG: phosphatase domain-containing protein [Bdellovibrionales bacterium]